MSSSSRSSEPFEEDEAVYGEPLFDMIMGVIRDPTPRHLSAPSYPTPRTYRDTGVLTIPTSLVLNCSSKGYTLPDDVTLNTYEKYTEYKKIYEKNFLILVDMYPVHQDFNASLLYESEQRDKFLADLHKYEKKYIQSTRVHRTSEELLVLESNIRHSKYMAEHHLKNISDIQTQRESNIKSINNIYLLYIQLQLWRFSWIEEFQFNDCDSDWFDEWKKEDIENYRYDRKLKTITYIPEYGYGFFKSVGFTVKLDEKFIKTKWLLHKRLSTRFAKLRASQK